MNANIVVDTRGLFCPVPIMKTAEAARNLESGSVIEVVSDDPAIEFDMPAWCASAGHSIRSARQEGTVFRYIIVTR
jgi:TusA-related sulfurtransferase